MTGKADTSLRMRALLRLAWVLAGVWLFAWYTAAPAAEAPRRVTVVLSGGETVYAQTLRAFREALFAGAGQAAGIELSVITAPPPGRLPAPPVQAPDLLVPVGTRAARIVGAWPFDAPVLNILVTRDAFISLWHSGAGTAADSARPASAIYLEQPWERQLALIRLTLPRLHRLGVLFGGHSRRYLDGLRAAAAGTGIELDMVDFDSFAKPVAGLRRVIDVNDAVLALPDPAVLTPTHAKWMLYMAYQRGVPVIGFSHAMVEAGALGAVYSEPAQIGRQAAEAVLRLLPDAGGERATLPPPQYPRYFRVAINHAVARSLGLSLPDGTRLARALSVTEEVQKWRARY